MIKVLVRPGDLVEYKDPKDCYYNIATNHGVLEIHLCGEYTSRIIAAYPKGLWVGVVNETEK